MGKKRRHSETEASAAVAKSDNTAPERPKRTLLGWKDNKAEERENDSPLIFRNKEKVLVTCSRRINFRYRHLMLNLALLLPYCMKDNMVESK
ncbi:Ribosome bioproteinsis protein BRX1 2 [Ancistrocladus abbreviatus]